MNCFNLFKQTNIYIKTILIIYVLSFLGATYNHVADLIRGGLFPYQQWNENVTVPLNIYWTLLTLFDLLSIILLLSNITLGIAAFGIVIISDVLINSIYTWYHYGFCRCLNFEMVCQFLFMVFLLITAPFVLKEKKLLLVKNNENVRNY